MRFAAAVEADGDADSIGGGGGCGGGGADGGALLPFWGVVRRVFGRFGHASCLHATKIVWIEGRV